jgi:sec-independent protein translocase protein TatA
VGCAAIKEQTMRAGFWEILLIVVLVLILFGHSKIPDLMKNLANGINVFKKELKTDDKKTAAVNRKSSTKTPVKKSERVAVKKAPTKKKRAVKK